jgi:tRNA-dihydrouridine synthase C
MRLGWDDPKDLIVNAEMATRAGAAWITIHGRTRLQGYKPPAYWHPIGELRRQLPIPVVANGDIWNLDDLRRCQDITGCSHFMLGRGAIADPSLPQRAAAAIQGRTTTPPKPPQIAPSGWSAWLTRFAALAHGQERRPGFLPGRLKQWAKMAHQRVPNTWYEKIKRLDTTEDILAVVQQETGATQAPMHTPGTC